jgi:NAD(P)-dependent dehydrogenase (short-subunit alcohol dehydrogenase family)
MAAQQQNREENGSAPVNMAGKVVLVTGATAGIGKETVRQLARLGATVVGVGRNAPKIEAVQSELRAETGSSRIHFLMADLQQMSDVRRLAADLRSRYDRLDVLVNNAGAIFWEYGETPEGYERTWALNHLSYYLLTSELLDLLKASAPSRVVNTASNAHRGGAIDFEDLNSRKNYGAWRAYNQSKLANILFSNELARRLQGTGVTSNALHPGVVKTEFGATINGPMSVGFNLMKEATAISPEKGSQTTLYLATSPEVAGVTGQHFAKCKPVEPAPQAKDEETARRLWEVTAQMLAPVMAQAPLP